MLYSRSKKNIITGLLYQIINTLLGFILPYLFITEFGSDTNGLLASITQLFVYINLLESGVGDATVQSLYRPIALKDKKSISSIMSATAQYYRKTSIGYAILMFLVAIVYPQVITTRIPGRTVFHVIVLQGMAGVWRYLVQAKYSLLLRAEGRVYILNILSLIVSVLKNAGKIVAIALGFDIVAVQCVHFAVGVLESIIVVVYIKRVYPWLNIHETPDFDAISSKNQVLVRQISWLIFNHTDVLLLTIFSRDLVLVSIYSLYVLIFEAIQNVITVVTTGTQFRLGEVCQKSNLILQQYYLKYERWYIWLACTLFSATYLLVGPFIGLYINGVTDGNYLMEWLPELFLLYKMLYIVRSFRIQLINVTGHFRQTSWIAVIETCINLLLSMCLVHFWNIYGVLIGSIGAVFFSSIIYTRYTQRKIIQDNSAGVYIRMAFGFAATAVFCFIVKRIMPSINSYGKLFGIAVLISGCSAFFFYINGAFIYRERRLLKSAKQ